MKSSGMRKKKTAWKIKFTCFIRMKTNLKKKKFSLAL